MSSEFLDLSFENNLVSIYDNVRYISGISSLSADKAEIDIINKKTKIFMESPIKKFKLIIYQIMAIIKNLELKVLSKKNQF